MKLYIKRQTWFLQFALWPHHLQQTLLEQIKEMTAGLSEWSPHRGNKGIDWCSCGVMLLQLEGQCCFITQTVGWQCLTHSHSSIPAYSWVRGRVHPGQVASPPKSHIYKQTTTHSHIHIYRLSNQLYGLFLKPTQTPLCSSVSDYCRLNKVSIKLPINIWSCATTEALLLSFPFLLFLHL